MSRNLDRLGAALASVVRGADPLNPYGRLYRCIVMSQSSDLQRVDVVPDGPGALPPMGNVPLWTGIAGASVRLRLTEPVIDPATGEPKIDPTTGKPAYRRTPAVRVLVGWADARPDRPYAALFGATPMENVAEVIVAGQVVTIEGGAIKLGASALEAVLHGTTYDLAVKALAAQQQALNVALAALAAALAAPPAAAIGGAAQTAAGAVASVATAMATESGVFQSGQYLSDVVKTE